MQHAILFHGQLSVTLLNTIRINEFRAVSVRARIKHTVLCRACECVTAGVAQAPCNRAGSALSVRLIAFLWPFSARSFSFTAAHGRELRAHQLVDGV